MIKSLVREIVSTDTDYSSKPLEEDPLAHERLAYECNINDPGSLVKILTL